MFIAGAVVVGGIIVAHDDHSRYSEYDRHSKYGDSEIRRNIKNYENRVNSKKSEVQRLLSEYKNLPSYDLDKAKADMQRELENEISEDKKELEQINKMISKINELELQARQE